jgi:hypothetical protein
LHAIKRGIIYIVNQPTFVAAIWQEALEMASKLLKRLFSGENLSFFIQTFVNVHGPVS